MKIVVVGFNVKMENSVFYEKLENPTAEKLGNIMFKAFMLKNCDFVSVRAIKTEKGAE
jgi:hypothetical protein